MNEATNTALAVNHTGWVIEVFDSGTGWRPTKRPIYVTKEEAQVYKELLERVCKNREFRVYEALTDVSKAAKIRSLAEWPYKLGE